MIHDGIYQRAGMIARSRMHHHAAGLVDYRDVIVLIDNLKRDVLGFYLKSFRFRHLDGDDIAVSDRVLLGRYGLAVHTHQAFFYQSDGVAP